MALGAGDTVDHILRLACYLLSDMEVLFRGCDGDVLTERTFSTCIAPFIPTLVKTLPLFSPLPYFGALTDNVSTSPWLT